MFGFNSLIDGEHIQTEINNKFPQIDPILMIFCILGCIITYVYFACEFICQILGLFIPLTWMFGILNMKTSKEKNIKIKSLMKYFIIYGHIEFLSLVVGIIGMYFYHLRILILVVMLYMSTYRDDWLGNVYGIIIFYDKVAIRMICKGWQRVTIEYDLARKK